MARPQRRPIHPPLDGIGGPASPRAVRRWHRPPDPAVAAGCGLGPSVGTDVDRFVRAASTSDPGRWLHALSLVRGRLFDGLSLSDWAVLDGTSAELESMVAVTALQGAEEALRVGSGEEAEWMIRRGLRVSPYDERLYRGLLRATEAKGNRLGLRLAMAELLSLASDGDEACLHPQTLALYRELAHR